MNTVITRRFEFDAAHRVLGHSGKCRHLHGHRYVAEITVKAVQLDDLDMVLDFAKVKGLIGAWIESNWDHNILLNYDDPQLEHFGQTEERMPYVMGKCNPTAEKMAEHLAHAAQHLLSGFTVTHVRIYETPNCWADWYLEEQK